MTEIVNGVLLRKNQVLLARRSAMRKAYAGRWSFPGGHVEAGENLEQALRRELLEEVGIEPVEYRPLASVDDPVFAGTTYHLYAVTSWTGDPVIRDHEHTELMWVSLSKATSMDDLALEDYRAVFAELVRSGR